MTAVPRFSVLVPTRDRPDLVQWCLESLIAQTWSDFEVIVADNPVHASSRDVVDRIDDERVRYVSPDRPISMADNWELALDQARGDYISVLIDKSVLLSTALERAAAAIGRVEPDVISWWNEGFTPVSEGAAAGWYEPYFQLGREEAYDPRELLAASLQFSARRGTESTRYFRGKICFGAYSRSLVERIRAAQGRLFFPIAPDYTSRAAALSLARSAVDVGRPLMLSYRTNRSNGPLQRADAGHARRFLAETDVNGSILHALPISGLYASLHNLVAYDGVSTVQRIAPGAGPSLDLPALLMRAGEDLDLVEHWDDAEQEREQRERLADVIDGLGAEKAEAVRAAIASAAPRRLRARAVRAIRTLLNEHRWLRSVETRIRRSWAMPRRAPSIVAATRLAESRTR